LVPRPAISSAGPFLSRHHCGLVRATAANQSLAASALPSETTATAATKTFENNRIIKCNEWGRDLSVTVWNARNPLPFFQTSLKSKLFNRVGGPGEIPSGW
jgi:hypothetical protein